MLLDGKSPKLFHYNVSFFYDQTVVLGLSCASIENHQIESPLYNCGKRAIVPSSFIISPITPADLKPAKMRSRLLCPVLSKDNSCFCNQWNICPGRAKSCVVSEFARIKLFEFYRQQKYR
jgi:hypothetical protein